MNVGKWHETLDVTWDITGVQTAPSKTRDLNKAMQRTMPSPLHHTASCSSLITFKVRVTQFTWLSPDFSTYIHHNFCVVLRNYLIIGFLPLRIGYHLYTNSEFSLFYSPWCLCWPLLRSFLQFSFSEIPLLKNNTVQ